LFNKVWICGIRKPKKEKPEYWNNGMMECWNKEARKPGIGKSVTSYEFWVA